MARSLPTVVRRARNGEAKAAFVDLRPLAAQGRSIDRSRQRIKGERVGLAERVARLRRSNSDQTANSDQTKRDDLLTTDHPPGTGDSL